MSHPVLLKKSAYQRSLWKNGLGHTDQIAIHPSTADLRRGDYLWRISSAVIGKASEFSLFPDHDRALVILTGGGVRLTHSDDGFEDTVELPCLQPYEFPGDIRSRCELRDGPVTDLSVFFQKDRVNAAIEVIHLEKDAPWDWHPSGKWNLLFSVQGEFAVENAGGEAVFVQVGDAVQVEGGDEVCPVTSRSVETVFISITLEA